MEGEWFYAGLFAELRSSFGTAVQNVVDEYNSLTSQPVADIPLWKSWITSQLAISG